MKILVADDEIVTRLKLEALLRHWNYQVVTAADGNEAWRILQQPEAPRLALVDWIMPEMDGTELCRNVHGLSGDQPIYLILLTSKDAKADIVAGLQSGANDYITKPFDREE